MAVDIRNMPEVVEVINAILNNHGIAEIKNESRKDDANIVVVEITRSVKTKRK